MGDVVPLDKEKVFYATPESEISNVAHRDERERGPDTIEVERAYWFPG